LALVPERDKVFTDLTVAEHFRLAHRRRDGRSEIEAEMLELFPALKPHLYRSAGFLSGGERQMLAIATALFSRPKLLLIDEMSQGLAPALVMRLAEAVDRLHHAGLTMIIVEQNVPVALELADRVCVLEAGRMGGAGEVADPVVDAAIKRAFLGNEAALRFATK
jgi:branched-chain amino acid transport system ATP-binding protein